MSLGAKTVAVLVQQVTEDASMTALEAPGNSSIKMKSKEALEKICEPLKKHKCITKVDLSDCEITDDGCVVLGELLKENHVIEELNLAKNKISSEGAKTLADALITNKGVRTLNLMQQAVTNFGEDTVDRFITMFNDNITLTKILWRVESKKAFILNKLQTRNVEIKKRQDKGEDFNSYLPDHMKQGAVAPPAEAEAAESPAEADRPARKRTSVTDMEEHIKAVEAAVGDLPEAEGEGEGEAEGEDKPSEADKPTEEGEAA